MHEYMAGVNRLVRAIFRAPVRLYDHGLGWLLGRRFLCLTHVGRKSGCRYRTVLEVIGLTNEEVTVVAGLGPSSDWFRNLQAGGSAYVELGRARFVADHRVLGHAEAAAAIADYERRNRLVLPIVRRVLTALAGWPYDGSRDARERLVRQLPLVAFRPSRLPVSRDAAGGTLRKC
jgi:deazaflavin-dependent oxidoreductase (nitroreductase family)